MHIISDKMVLAYDDEEDMPEELGKDET